MVDEWEDDATEEETVEVAEEAPVFKAPSWRSKISTPETKDGVQVEYVGSGSFSILGFAFSHENRTQTVPSNIASLVLATGKFK